MKANHQLLIEKRLRLIRVARNPYQISFNSGDATGFVSALFLAKLITHEEFQYFNEQIRRAIDSANDALAA